MHIGIIGAGQLGQMLGFAAAELGDSCTFLDPAPDPPAAAAGRVIRAAYDDPEALLDLAAGCDVLTYEFENVPVEALLGVAGRVPVYPPPAALRQAQDRLLEKQLFAALDIPVPACRAVDSLQELTAAVAAIGMPLVLKTRRLGYDGKGQYVVRDSSDVRHAWESLSPAPLIAEQWVEFDCEVSAIGVRGRDGDVVLYPLTQNEHQGGILRVSRAPVEAPLLTELATTYVQRLLGALDYVGVLALELFVIGDALAANEFAPRVHNSGHWTIEGAATSQFANHIRAITGRPLGPAAALGHAGMVNLIGEIPAAARRLGSGHLHDYGKSPRPGRKLGHITTVAGSASGRERLLAEIGQIVTRRT